jgi:hypothetical protein
MSDDNIDWQRWLNEVTGARLSPIEQESLVPPSQEGDGGVFLSSELGATLAEDWEMFLSDLENTGFSEPIEGAADSVFLPMEDDALGGELLTTNLDLFAPDTNIAGGQDGWDPLLALFAPDTNIAGGQDGWDPLLAQNPVPDGTLSRDWLAEATGKRMAEQEGDSEPEPSAAKRPRLDPPWHGGPAIGAQPIAGPFGDVHIQAPAPQEPVLLGDEEWLSEEHVDAGMGYLAAQLRRDNPDLAKCVQFVSVQTSSQLQNLGEEFGGHRQSLLSHLCDENTRYLFLPINNGGSFAGTHWSLLFLDRSDPATPQGYHYDSLPDPGFGQLTIAAGLARRLGVGADYFDGHMVDPCLSG